MINRNRKKGKLNNKGFSLVEVLVAMMIMAVVSIPIMKCFTTGAVINAKARERQRESTVAQSIMESLKAYTIDEVKGQIGAPNTTATYSSITDFHMLNNVFGSVKYLNNVDGSTSFYLNNIQTDSNKFYDAVVNIDATKASGPNAFNGVVSYDTFGAVDEYYDAVYVADSTLDAKAIGGIIQLIVDHLNNDLHAIHKTSGASFTASNIDYTNLKLTRTADITVTGSGNQYKVDVKYTYRYSLNQPYKISGSGSTQHWSGSNIEFVPTVDADKYSKTIYDNTLSAISGTKLENVYFFYYPLYKDAYTSSGSIKVPNTEYDNINIHVGALTETPNIYIFKQFNPSIPDAKYDEYEKKYEPNIKVDGASDDDYDVKNFSDSAKLFWNLCDNVHGGANNQKLTFNGSTLTMTRSDPEDGHRHGFREVTNDSFMYDIEINLYEHGADITADTPLLTLTGTKNE